MSSPSDCLPDLRFPQIVLNPDNQEKWVQEIYVNFRFRRSTEIRNVLIKEISRL